MRQTNASAHMGDLRWATWYQPPPITAHEIQGCRASPAELDHNTHQLVSGWELGHISLVQNINQHLREPGLRQITWGI